MKLLDISISVILQSNTLWIHIGIAAVISALLIAVYYFQHRKLQRTYSRHHLSSILKEKELLQQLFDNMPDRIYFKDRESRFILANKYVSAIMGEKDPQDLIGKTDYDYYDKELAQPYFDDEQRIMKEGKPMVNKEERGLNLQGNEIVVATTKIPIRDSNNSVIGIIGIGRDISSQKEVERELKENASKLMEKNALLEEHQEEIEQISEEQKIQAEHLENANKELEKQNDEIRAKSTELNRLITSRNKLLSIIGHDLKNPLNSIIGFADLLHTNLASLDKEQVKNYSEIIHSSSKSAHYLLENLLNWSLLQTGSLQRNPVRINICDLVKDVIPLYKATASGKRIELINKVDNDLHLFADRNMVHTVVRNITGNAIKYTNEDGTVTFSANRRNKGVAIMIEDTGIGMTEDLIQKLFASENIHSTPGTAGEKGTGLGLVIAREFVEKNHGKMEVKSEPGRGTCFIITLPAEEYI